MIQTELIDELQRLADADEQRRQAETATLPRSEAAVYEESATDPVVAPEPTSPRLAPMHEQALAALVDGLDQYVDQHSLAELVPAGVSRSSVCAIRSGSERNPSLRIVTALCRQADLKLTITKES